MYHYYYRFFSESTKQWKMGDLVAATGNPWREIRQELEKKLRLTAPVRTHGSGSAHGQPSFTKPGKERECAYLDGFQQLTPDSKEIAPLGSEDFITSGSYIVLKRIPMSLSHHASALPSSYITPKGGPISTPLANKSWVSLDEKDRISAVSKESSLESDAGAFSAPNPRRNGFSTHMWGATGGSYGFSTSASKTTSGSNNVSKDYVCHYCSAAAEHMYDQCPKRSDPLFIPHKARKLPNGVLRDQFRPASTEEEKAIAFVTNTGALLVWRDPAKHKAHSARVHSLRS